MLSPLRNRFGIPGVISVIALVFAMFGGAYAATNNGGGGKATASAKKGPPGPRGPKGKTGATGPAGPAGPQGSAGAKGDTGAAGSNGSNGSNGVGVTSSPEPVGAHCAKGGSKFVSASPEPTYACNGAQGVPGAQGPPGPTCDEATGECLLPSGATETGVWAVKDKGIPGSAFSISFPLRLAGVFLPHYVTPEEVATETAPAECPGSFGNPEAKLDPSEEEEGQFCMYERVRVNLHRPFFINFFGQTRSGVAGEFELENEAAVGEANGSWAVTSPAS